jgi:chromosome segregation ATPase
MRFGELGRFVDDRSALEQALSESHREIDKLQGRYNELQERAADIERRYDAERRRTARLEVELEHERAVTESRAGYPAPSLVS